MSRFCPSLSKGAPTIAAASLSEPRTLCLAHDSDLGLIVNNDELRDLIAAQAEVETQDQRVRQTGFVVRAVELGMDGDVAVAIPGVVQPPRTAPPLM